MNNYPSGMPGPRKTVVTLECRECGHIWGAAAIKDLGMCDLIDEQDWKCKECGGRGE